MKQSPAQVPVLTLQSKVSNIGISPNEIIYEPFRDIILKLKSLFDTFETWITAILNKLGVSLCVVSKDVERVLANDSNEISCIRPENLKRS